VIRRLALLAFPGLTLLDLVGVYDSLRRIAPMGIDSDVSVRIIGTKASIEDESGVTMVPDAVYESLRPYDLLVVPGGAGTRRLMRDAQLLDYLGTWDRGRPVASVCTGSLLLGAAGMLKGKRATTHHLALDELAPFCKEVVRDQRIVEDGLVTTAAGVSSSLDLGLHLVERWWDAAARERIAAVMEYRGYSAV
jgi:cyclohexyl-isocyanide hydratase